MQIFTEAQARRRIIDLVRHTKSALHLSRPLFYGGVNDPVAHQLGIEIKEAELPPGDEGEYIPEATPPIIVLDPQIADPDRIDFTFFHEVSHHLIRRDDALYAFLHEFASISDKDFRNALERYCNFGAAEFLVPSDEIRLTIEERGFSITLVEHFDTRYYASKPAIGIQLAQCTSHECFVVICEYGLPPRPFDDQERLTDTPGNREPQLYVLYSSSSPANKYSIARFVPIPKDHLITVSYIRQELLKGRAIIPFRSGTPWECDCEAFCYKGKVYAAFNISPPPLPPSLQPRLI